MAINPISLTQAAGVSQAALTPSAAASSAGSSSLSFQDLLDSLNTSQENSDSLVQQIAAGGSTDLHTFMIGMEENDVNFRIALAIRDKLVDAYREIMRMQV
jgi:flagellar hook-basal body complex protein FliE